MICPLKASEFSLRVSFQHIALCAFSSHLFWLVALKKEVSPSIQWKWYVNSTHHSPTILRQRNVLQRVNWQYNDLC